MGERIFKSVNSKYKGIIYIIISSLCFALMSMFVRLSGDLPSIQKSFFRNLVAFIVASIMLIKNGEKLKIKGESLKYLILRATFGTIGILCNFYAVDKLLLSDANMLNKLSPFFAIIFSYLILKEKITLFQGSAVSIAFIGSLFVIKPSFVNMNFVPSLIGLCGGIAAGLAYTLVRKLGELGVKGVFIVFFFSGFSCFVTLPFLIFDYHIMSTSQIIFLLLAGISATGGQFFITYAYCHAPAKEISVFDYSQILFSAILGFIVFNQTPDILSFIGYTIIISIAVLMYLNNVKGLFKNKR